jgi:hypothetical protein
MVSDELVVPEHRALPVISRKMVLARVDLGSNTCVRPPAADNRQKRVAVE